MDRKYKPLFGKKNHRRGFTLMETILTVGIIALLCGAAIPSTIYLKNSLDATQRDNYAKSIYLSAQTQLALMNNAGTLSELHPLSSTPHTVPATDNADFPVEQPIDGMFYITSASGDEEIFDRMLPYGSIDETLRSRQILIEYNPVTASVFSVFYSEDDDPLGYDNVARDNSTRRRLKVGYYDGSDDGSRRSGGVIGSDPEPQEYVSRPTLVFDNASGTVKMTVPIPGDLAPATFLENVDVRLNIVGDRTNAAVTNIDLKDTTDPRVGEPELSGNVCTFTYILDSTENPALGFTNLSGSFLAGENVTLSADGSYHIPDAQLGQMTVDIKDVVCHRVNPLFAANTGSTISVANARNLQNLNLYAAGEDIRLIDITDDIKFENGQTFTPISNKMLFGSAEFYTVEDADDPVWQDVQYEHPNREITNGSAVFTDVIDTDSHARVRGNGHSITDLKIADDPDRDFTGMFTYFNGNIDGLTITGADVTGSGSATGILLGTAGCNAVVSNCTVENSVLSASGSAGSESYIGGVIGYAAEATNSGVNASNLALSVSDSSALSYVGGLIGSAEGGSVKNSSVSGTLTKTSGTAGCVGGAIGVERDGAVFHAVNADMDLSGWGGTAGASTHENPSGLDVNVGKFVGSAESGEYRNCSGTGSSGSLDYQFLGHIECQSEEYDLGAVGDLYQLENIDVNNPSISMDVADTFYEMATPLTDSVVYISDYQATLDNCTFTDTSDALYSQIVSGCGYYRKATGVQCVTNTTMEVSKYYLIMSYDGSKILYPDGKSGSVILPINAKGKPKSKNVNAMIEDGVLYLDPSVDITPYVWELTAEPGTNNRINLKSVATGEYLAYNRTYEPFMTTGYRSSAFILGDLSPDIAFLSTNPPDWTYIADGDCFWFAEYFHTDLLLNEYYTTLCLTFSRNNEISRTWTVNLDPEGVLTHIFFQGNYYDVPSSDNCKFRVFEVGQDGKINQDIIENTTIDFLKANTIISKEPATKEPGT